MTDSRPSTAPTAPTAPDAPTPPRRYRHFKGGVYELVCEAILESDPSVTMIVYRAANGTIWTRTSDVFFEVIEHEGQTMPRFRLIDNEG